MTEFNRRKLLHVTAGLVGGFASVSCARAQAFPSSTVRFIAGSPPGSAPDTIARVVAEKLQTTLGKPVIVEGRGGAGGMLATQLVERGTPDGHLINISGSGYTISSLLNPGVVSTTEITPLAMLATLPIVLVVPPDRAATLGDFVKTARANPGRMVAVSAGVGSTTHISLEKFRSALGIDFLHVPQRGAAEAVTELIAGRADLYFAPVFSVREYIASGKLRALAISSSTRTGFMVDLPTTVELGFPGTDYNLWVGAFISAKTPDDLVGRLHRELNAVLEAKDLQEKFLKIGAEVRSMSLAEFQSMVGREIETNTALFAAIGMKPK